MPRPSGWRPTAFYIPNGKTTAYTNRAVVVDGRPVEWIDDPVDADGILLRGPWVLESYDDKWGHARYRRPGTFTGLEVPFGLA